jgi:hypothetical protein
MINHRKNSPAALRFEERRRREDDAPRLHESVPDPFSLRLEIEERSGIGGTRHVRQILIDRASALFLVPCGDSRRVDGAHDLTTAVMHGLGCSGDGVPQRRRVTGLARLEYLRPRISLQRPRRVPR